jgi:p-aminobenzoyl-glutamate transporter AbgT
MNPQQDSKPDPRITTDFPKFIFTSLADQIKQADTKAFGLLTIIGIVTAALVTRLNALKTSLGITHPLWIFIFSFSFVMILVSIKCVVRVVYPRAGKNTSKSMTYFRDIAAISREEYVRKGESLDAASIVRETYDNTYTLAQISNTKYKALREAIIVTVVTIAWTVCVLLFS